jgi:hypothetical protein
MAITHTPMVIMGLGRGVRVTGVMVDAVIMVLGVLVTGVMGGIADNTFFGKLYYNDVIIPFSTLNDLIGWFGNFWATLLRRTIFTLVRIPT